MKLARENVVVFSPGLRRPVVLRKMRYYKHPDFRGLFAAEDAPRVGLSATDTAAAGRRRHKPAPTAGRPRRCEPDGRIR